jgi:hypothetical protein
MNEADEEHHLARVLVAEFDPTAVGPITVAKFTVLAESVRHHIKEEEGEVLPKAKGVEMDFEALGARMPERKRELHKERHSVASIGLRSGSPTD